MKKILYCTIIGIVMLSCEKKSTDPIKLESSTFEYTTPNCLPSTEFEMTCTDWINFRSDNRADVLIGGGDIIVRYRYILAGDTILLSSEEGDLSIEFLVIDNNTLKLISINGISAESLWKRV